MILLLKKSKTKPENVAIEMHYHLRLPDALPVVLRFNYNTVPRLKSVKYPLLSYSVLMVTSYVRL